MAERGGASPGLLGRLTALKWRVAWGYAGTAALLLLARPTPTSIARGVPFVLLGELIRIVANGTLVKDKALTSQGLYAHMRHPLYVGSALLGIGFLVMAAHPVLTVAFLLVYLILYRRTILREEEKLEEHFGTAYLDWASRVPPFLPRRLNVREIAGHSSFRRSWANKEYEGVLGVVAVTGVLYLKFLLLA